MKLRNYDLEPLILYLNKMKLAGKASRMRTRFINILTEKYKLFKDEHMQLIKEYANLDEDGNPKIIVRDGQRVFDIKDELAFNKEFNELLFEEVIIEENEVNKNMLLSVRDSILNSEIEVSEEEAFLYNEWCEQFENIYKNEGDVN